MLPCRSSLLPNRLRVATSSFLPPTFRVSCAHSHWLLLAREGTERRRQQRSTEASPARVPLRGRGLAEPPLHIRTFRCCYTGAPFTFCFPSSQHNRAAHIIQSTRPQQPTELGTQLSVRASFPHRDTGTRLLPIGACVMPCTSQPSSHPHLSAAATDMVPSLTIGFHSPQTTASTRPVPAKSNTSCHPIHAASYNVCRSCHRPVGQHQPP